MKPKTRATAKKAARKTTAAPESEVRVLAKDFAKLAGHKVRPLRAGEQPVRSVSVRHRDAQVAHYVTSMPPELSERHPGATFALHPETAQRYHLVKKIEEGTDRTGQECLIIHHDDATVEYVYGSVLAAVTREEAVA